MRTDKELVGLMADLESDRVERKESAADTKKICQAICAFANDLPNHGVPGVLFVGVADAGSPTGLEITDELLLRLAQMKDDGRILPFPSIVVEKKTLAGCDVAVVEVQPSAAPPVRYDGRVWIRVGPRRGIATPDEERRLTEKRRWRDRPFDAQPTGADIGDLDLVLFEREYLPSAIHPDVLEENTRELTDQLAALRFVDRERRPNVSAILFFGRDPRMWVPGAYVQFARFDGLELTDPVRDQKELAGPLSLSLRELDDLLKLNITTASDPAHEDREVRQPDYPVAALQQLTRNAIMHRSYEATNAPTRIHWFDDRIEISNPGGLFGHVNEDNFGQPGVTDYRNPLVAEAMKTLGYVQRFGMGIPLTMRELDKNGNPQPRFEFRPSNVHVTVRRRSA